jgi:hypothetical protein
LHFLNKDKLVIENLQQTNRYFVVNSGAKLYKRKKHNNSLADLVAGYQIAIFNNYYKSDNYDINYKYYIKEAKKVINTIEPLQIKLF